LWAISTKIKFSNILRPEFIIFGIISIIAMYDHKGIKNSLEEELRDFSELMGNGWKVESERHIEIPVKPNSRRIDVAVQTDQPNQEGYAFEIKTINSNKYFLHGQLRDYLIAGFQPILIGPESLVEKTVPAKPVPIDWILDFLGVSFVIVEGDDQIGFDLEESRMTGDHIKIFFEHFC
jgi:hypothetical protein